MTKMEFLNKLQEALSNDLNPMIVQENINYYQQYIEDEIRKGRSEEEVIAELGDPWALAKTIADSEEIKRKKNNTYENYNYSETYTSSSSEKPQQEKGNWNRLGNGIKIFIIFLLAIVVIVAIASLIAGIFSALLPVMVPILLVVIVVRLFAGRR